MDAARPVLEVKMKTLTGNESFTFKDNPVGKFLTNFWSWNSSDLFNNTLRGALAEFIVASALEIDLDECREDWNAFDLLSRSNKRIEVKCSAYIQSWNLKKLSKIIFSIRPARSWSPESNYSDEVKRWSDLYVFCVYASKDREESPLQLDKWDFYVLPTKVLDQTCGPQQTITLSSLLLLNPLKTDYKTLLEVVDSF